MRQNTKPKKKLRIVLYVTREQWHKAEAAAYRIGLTSPAQHARALLLQNIQSQKLP